MLRLCFFIVLRWYRGEIDVRPDTLVIKGTVSTVLILKKEICDLVGSNHA